MKIRTYLLIAIVAFIVVITGSDLIARLTVAGDTFGEAVREYLRWVSLTPLGIIFLFAPFAGAALICGAANRRARTPSAAALFVLALALLAYFYFDGFQASQHAMLEKKWTAAALSIGLLPFFVGMPMMVVVAVIAAAIAWLDRRRNPAA